MQQKRIFMQCKNSNNIYNRVSKEKLMKRMINVYLYTKVHKKNSYDYILKKYQNNSVKC